jgi:hypothetical protein
MEIILSQKIPPNFCCKKCDYYTSRQKDYNKHLLTLKHKNFQNGNILEIQEISKIPMYECNQCTKKFKTNSGLWKHKQKCIQKDQQLDDLTQEIFENNNLTDKDIILMLLKQNNEFKELIVEQNKSIIDISSNKNNSVVSNTITSNSHNKTFNLQVFLNETCKDAMNIMDFVDSLQIQLSDLENVGRNGFVAGISDIILKNLRALDITQRPIHCSDQKREIVYVKDDNQWHKEHPDNEKLKKAIKYIAHKNTCLIKEWKAKYPDCGQAASRKSDLYNKIVYEAMSLDNANAEKIIKRIAKEIGIEK